jgi:hypothetical protein
VAAAQRKYTDVTGKPPPAPAESPSAFTGTLDLEPAEAPTTPAPAARTEQRVRDAVRSLSTSGFDWVGISDLRAALGDLDQDEFARVLRDLQRNDPNVSLAPESNRKALTAADHDSAVQLGGEPQHLISIRAPRDTTTLDSVRADGVANATDEQLENARLDPLIDSNFYDEIRAEQRRRQK